RRRSPVARTPVPRCARTPVRGRRAGGWRGRVRRTWAMDSTGMVTGHMPAAADSVHSMDRNGTESMQAIPTKLPKVGTTIFTVMSQLAAEHGAVNLGQGFPDFPVPPRLVDALERAMRAGHNQYAPMTGIPALRHASADKTARCYGWTPHVDSEITVTSGASEAIFDAIHALVRAGEEVIVLDPCYDCYEPAIDLAGARAVHVALDPATFAPDWNAVRAAITPKTRMLMVNSPHNPSGAMLSAADLQAPIDILDGTDIVLLSDEVYEPLVFDGARAECALLAP